MITICVYGLSFNQESMIEGWIESTQDADMRVMLDLGSQDHTTEKLRQSKCLVQEKKFESLRFDSARNFCLQLVPDDIDICVVLDPDERLSPNWRKEIEAQFTQQATHWRSPVFCKWSVNGDSLLQSQFSSRIHSRLGYQWLQKMNPQLVAPAGATEFVTSSIQIFREKKSPYHTAYSLIDFSGWLEESNTDSHDLLWYGDYLMSRGDNEKALVALGLYMHRADGSRPPGEYAFACRLAGRCMKQLNYNPELFLHLYLKGVAEASFERESWTFYALEMAKRGEWPQCFSSSLNALRNTDSLRSFVIEPLAWQGLPQFLHKLSAQRMGISPQVEL